jgi:tyrosinase
MNFSNEAWIGPGNPSGYDSVESVHDLIHGLVGGGNNGNMQIVSISAFDPAFWMHHA